MTSQDLKKRSARPRDDAVFCSNRDRNVFWGAEGIFNTATSALSNLSNKLGKYKNDIIALQEIRCKETANVLETAFAIKNNLVGNVFEYSLIDKRSCSIRHKGNFFKTRFIYFNAPIGDIYEKTKEIFL
ncbi:hypothetical protein CWI36_1668p0010 [Hamiltosporidium magnivora]|uniref:Endonuclease/exonuclease/phosphatase domain-containing protein n=1 Tax=Hamiltosporidium magnivora TaxID=148818 RepID=A0A4Q9KZ86_9MICR|nr:hypothetical protein CWI36_1668p0010 [Hamiltosporidium magnivora]